MTTEPIQLKPEEREEYIRMYAQHLGVTNNAFSIALHIIREEKAFTRACIFMFNFSAKNEAQLQYCRKAGEYLKNLLGDNYNSPELTETWLYEFVVGYTQEVDATYESIS